MNTARRLHFRLADSIAFLVFLAAVPGIAFVQAEGMEIPENAHLDYSGTGWDCDPPYRRRLDGCALR